MPTKAFSQAKLLGTDNTISVTSLSADIPITDKLTTVADLPSTGVIGEQAFVEENNRLYIWNGSGWYNIALINTTPTWDSGGQPEGSYVLDADSSQKATTITLAASDPEGLPISYTYVTGGSMDSIATISQDSSVFTITPKTEAQAPDGGTGSITFRASDGVNILPSVSSFTLNFISFIENSRYTTLLATATGTSDNNNITDSSSNSHSITVNGDTHAGTFSPYRSGGYLMSFNGTNESFEPNHSSASGLGTTWSFSFWAYIPTSGVTNNSPYVVDFYRSNGADDSFALQVFTSTKKIELTTRIYGVTYNGIDYGLATATNLTCFDKWSYYVVSHSSGTTTLYIDGSSAGTSTGSAFSSIEASSVQNLMLGARKIGSSSEFAKVDIRDFHLKSEVHNGAVNNEPAVADSNTIILAAHKPYLAAQTGASTALAPVINNSVSTKPFSPYDYNEYDAADHGGSVYFDGSNDYLSISNPLSLTGDFTVSAWVYPEGTSKVQVVASPNLSPNNQFFIDANNFMGTYDANTTNNAQGVGVKRNAWNYLVWSRTGSSLNMYVNGQQASNSPSSTNTYNLQRIGILSSANGPMLGYISDLQIKTSSTSAANAVPPTAPLSSSGTSLHIKGTDASIIDKSQNTNLKLVGNTTGSTTQVKFAGTKSMYFDGSSDRIEIDGPINLGTQPFTYETWVYTTDNSWIFMCIGNHDGSSSHATAGPIIEYVNNDFYLYNMTGGGNTSVEAFVHNQGWKHVAFCRQSNGNHDLYLDGTRIMNYTDAIWNSQDYGILDKILIGDYFSQFMSDFNGYFQDIRLTIGESRYTASFTPPTAPLEG